MHNRLRSVLWGLALLASALAWGPWIFAQAIPQPGGGGSGTFTGGALTSATTIADANFSVLDDGDPTKIAKFQASGISTGTTRTYTFPNGNATLAAIDITQTFSADVTIGDNVFLLSANGAKNAVIWRTTQTPDTGMLLTGTTANSWVIAEHGDSGFDAAHALQTNPTVFVENAAQDITQHNGMAYYGNQGRAVKALTGGAATSVVRIPVAASAGVGGTITFTIFAADATDQQTLTGVLQYAAVNKAATETCSTPTLTGTALNSNSTGTLTCTYACDTSPANAVDIQFNCTSSLTETTLDAYWRLDALGASEPLPQ